MQLNPHARPARRRSGLAAVLAIVALAGCSGSGSSCGSSCGGIFTTVDGNGQPIKFVGTKLDNVAQVRVTKTGFDFLNATHLNDLLANLNADNALKALAVPCIDLGVVLDACISDFGLYFDVVAGDRNFTGSCEQNEATPVTVQFKDLSWGFDAANQIVRLKLITHIATGDIVIRTKEEHSTLCGGSSAMQGIVAYNDENSFVSQKDTELDLDVKFSTSPDGRLEFNVTDQSIQAIVTRIDPAALIISGFLSDVACSADQDCAPGWSCQAGGVSPGTATGKRCVAPGSAAYNGNGCGSATGTYDPLTNRGATDQAQNLRCSGLFDVVNFGCDPNTSDANGAVCKIVLQLKDYLLTQLKAQFSSQITGLLRTQIDKLRCQRSADSTGAAHDCNDTNFRCPNDDNATPLTCDTSRGVCVPQGQSPLDPGPSGGTVPGPNGTTIQVGPHNCEPIGLGITGQLDVANLTDKVGFPPGAGLLVTMGLGSKTGASAVNASGDGIQLSAQAGTAPPKQNFLSVCVPPALPPDNVQPAALDFDAAANKPAGVTTYDLGFSVASQMLNRAMFDSYSAGLLCVSLSNKTTPFISSGLFKTFLPSLGLVTGGKDVPMAILLRPSTPPAIRVGKGTLKLQPDGTYVPDDPLVTVNFKGMNLDFYGLVDERQVRLFTLQADLTLPLALRVMPDNSLLPVLGGLDTVLTNIKALNNEMLAEDPGVVRDLLGAAVRLAQPLLAGLLKPVVLPSPFGLQIAVKGVSGAVPVSSNVAQDGYQHLAVYAGLSECGSGTPCAQYTVQTDARVVSTTVPADLDEVRGPNRVIPSVDIEASALSARRGAGAEFSYRVDGSLWSPWVAGPRFTVRDSIFLFQGHHTVEVIAREAGDDRTQDTNPVALDFFVSFEPPTAELVQRNDGSVVTKAHSVATPADKLLYSYRFAGQHMWSTPGPAHVFTADELAGRGLQVTVTDEGGRSALAQIGVDDAQALLQSGSVGCATSAQAVGPAGVLLALAAVLLARRRRA